VRLPFRHTGNLIFKALVRFLPTVIIICAVFDGNFGGMKANAAVNSAQTTCLVMFGHRKASISQKFLAEASRRFTRRSAQWHFLELPNDS
jgi:hypothetical protein